MDNKTNPIKYTPKVGGTDVKDTKMLGGQGSFTSAQNEENVTQPFKTGAAKDVRPGAAIVH